MQTSQACVKKLPAEQVDIDIQHHMEHLFWSVSCLRMFRRAELGHRALDEQPGNRVGIHVCTGTPVLQVSLACRRTAILSRYPVLDFASDDSLLTEVCMTNGVIDSHCINLHLSWPLV